MKRTSTGGRRAVCPRRGRKAASRHVCLQILFQSSRSEAAVDGTDAITTCCSAVHFGAATIGRSVWYRDGLSRRNTVSALIEATTRSGRVFNQGFLRTAEKEKRWLVRGGALQRRTARESLAWAGHKSFKRKDGGKTDGFHAAGNLQKAESESQTETARRVDADSGTRSSTAKGNKHRQGGCATWATPERTTVSRACSSNADG